MKKVIAIYPGSFDPPTNGHLDLIERGSKIFDELIVAILRDPDKNPLFSLGERRAMLEDFDRRFQKRSGRCLRRPDRGLRRREWKASAVLRGIRALSDYEYELQMAMMNRKLQPDLETVFMMPAEQLFLSEFPAGAGSGEARRIDSRDLVPEICHSGRLGEKLDPAIKLQQRKKAKNRGKRA